MSRPLKVVGRPLRWAPFAGFSVLFDPPTERSGASLAGGDRATASGAPAPDFFERLAQGLAAIVAVDAHRFEEGWLALPPSTYHVTAWDGVNDGNLDTLVPGVVDEVRGFVAGLPASLGHLPEVVDAVVLRSRLVTQARPPLELVFDGLVWNAEALLARLAVAPSGETAFAAFLEARRALSEEAKQHLGLTSTQPYVPHVTLGYFAEGVSVAPPASKLAEYDRALHASLGGATLQLTSCWVYAFTEMATYLRLGSSCAGFARG